MHSKRQTSKGEKSGKRLLNLQKTIPRCESYNKKKGKGGKESTVTNYTSKLCKSTNNIKEKEHHYRNPK